MKVLKLVISVTVFSMSPLFAQWTLQSTVSGLGDFPSISVYSPTGVVIAGGVIGSNQPKILRSTNNGLNWTDITGNLTSTPEIMCVWAMDGNTIFAGDGGPGSVGGNAKVWKTTNGGVNWTTILTTGGTSGFINGIVFSRTMPSFGIIESDPPSGPGQPYWIARTTNGGNNWVITSAPGITDSYSIFNTVVVIDNLFYGFGVDQGSKVYLTSDGGTNWNVRSLGIAGTATYGFAFSSDKTIGIGASESSLPMISRTTNGGLNWLQINSGGGVTDICRMKWVYNTNVCFLTGTTGAGGSVKKSTDNGISWVTQTTSGVEGLINIDLYYSSGTVYVYAIAQNGSIIKLQEAVTGIDPINNQVPTQYRLEQNFPNPFNPSTKFRFSLGKSAITKLIVFDALGREVSMLVSEYLLKGIYEIEWDASNFPSGVYFYKLYADDYSETKKMVLMK